MSEPPLEPERPESLKSMFLRTDWQDEATGCGCAVLLFLPFLVLGFMTLLFASLWSVGGDWVFLEVLLLLLLAVGAWIGILKVLDRQSPE